MIKIELTHLFIESINEPIRIICLILSFLIPYGIYKFNLYLHERGDPPWKKEKQGTAEK